MKITKILTFFTLFVGINSVSQAMNNDQPIGSRYLKGINQQSPNIYSNNFYRKNEIQRDQKSLYTQYTQIKIKKPTKQNNRNSHVSERESTMYSSANLEKYSINKMRNGSINLAESNKLFTLECALQQKVAENERQRKRLQRLTDEINTLKNHVQDLTDELKCQKENYDQLNVWTENLQHMCEIYSEKISQIDIYDDQLNDKDDMIKTQKNTIEQLLQELVLKDETIKEQDTKIQFLINNKYNNNQSFFNWSQSTINPNDSIYNIMDNLGNDSRLNYHRKNTGDVNTKKQNNKNINSNQTNNNKLMLAIHNNKNVVKALKNALTLPLDEDYKNKINKNSNTQSYNSIKLQNDENSTTINTKQTNERVYVKPSVNTKNKKVNSEIRSKNVKHLNYIIKSLNEKEHKTSASIRRLYQKNKRSINNVSNIQTSNNQQKRQLTKQSYTNNDFLTKVYTHVKKRQEVIRGIPNTRNNDKSNIKKNK